MRARRSIAACPTDHVIQADLDALKDRQQIAGSSGDYAVVGATLQIVGEGLCEALDVRAGDKGLDIAAGIVSLAATRRRCDVIATDDVPARPPYVPSKGPRGQR